MNKPSVPVVILASVLVLIGVLAVAQAVIFFSATFTGASVTPEVHQPAMAGTIEYSTDNVTYALTISHYYVNESTFYVRLNIQSMTSLDAKTAHVYFNLTKTSGLVTSQPKTVVLHGTTQIVYCPIELKTYITKLEAYWVTGTVIVS